MHISANVFNLREPGDHPLLATASPTPTQGDVQAWGAMAANILPVRSVAPQHLLTARTDPSTWCSTPVLREGDLRCATMQAMHQTFPDVLVPALNTLLPSSSV